MNLMTTVTDSIIDAEAWSELANDRLGLEVPALADCGIGVEVAPGNACAAVVAGWWDDVLTRSPRAAPGPRHVLAPPVPPPAPRRLRRDRDRRRRRRPRPTDHRRPAPVRHRPRRGRAALCAGSGCPTARPPIFIAAARDERTLQHDGSRVLAQAVAGAQLRVNNGVERIDRDRSLGPCRRSSPAASRSGTPTIASSRQDTNCSRRSCRLVSARRRDS